LRQNVSTKQRRALASKMGEVFEANIKTLSKEMQETLLDDLVTAFLNRLDVLTRVENTVHADNLTIRFSDDTLELIHDRT
jgi:uncharacterized protein